MDILTIYQGSDMALDLEGLTNEDSGAILNDAVVSVTLKTEAGVAVTGETWPKAMPFVANTHGVYRAPLSSTLNLIPGTRYRAEITAIHDGKQAVWSVDVLCKVRRR